MLTVQEHTSVVESSLIALAHAVVIIAGFAIALSRSADSTNGNDIILSVSASHYTISHCSDSATMAEAK